MKGNERRKRNKGGGERKKEIQIKCKKKMLNGKKEMYEKVEWNVRKNKRKHRNIRKGQPKMETRKKEREKEKMMSGDKEERIKR